MCFNLREELQAILYCAQLQASLLPNGGCFSPCAFLFIIKSSTYSVTFLPSQSHMENPAQCLTNGGTCSVVYTEDELVRIPSFQPLPLSLFFCFP